MKNVDNRVAAYFPAGKYDDVAFYYLPDSFILGAAISAIFVAYLIFTGFWGKHNVLRRLRGLLGNDTH